MMPDPEEGKQKQRSLALKRCSSVSEKEEEKKNKKNRSGGETNKESGPLKRCSSVSEKEEEKKKKNKKRSSGETNKESGPLKRSSSGSESEEKKRKRAKCAYPLFDSNYFYPSPVNNIEDKYDINEPSSDTLPEETYLEDIKPLKIIKGKKLPVDLFTLLSNSGKTSSLVRNNGERVGLKKAIAGKYLVICCFFVPMIANDTGTDVCRALIAIYNDLKKKNVNFEMVMVAKMRCSFIAEDEEEPAFNRFFSAFPCLAVPFSHSSSRDLICKLLGLGIGVDTEFNCLALDPDQTVLQTTYNIFYWYGAASYPFTDDHKKSINREDEGIKLRLDPLYRELELESRKNRLVDPPYRKLKFGEDEVEISSEPVTLAELLCCSPFSLLRKCGGSKKNRKRKISVSDLSKSKCVAVYLCFDGQFMTPLENIRRRCVKSNLQFKVVIVHLACFLDESSYFDAVKSALEEKGITSWWELPFVDQVSRNLFRLVSTQYEDSVIVWADGGRGGEIKGLEFMERFNSANEYPFTRTKWLDDRISGLRSLTLESFLGQNGRLFFPGHGHLKVSDLKNRNILLYLGSSDTVYRKLRDSYEQIKEDYPGSEVVFVPMVQAFLSDSNPVSEMPWPQLSSSVARPKGLWPDPILLVAFGEDNQIKSLRAQDYLNYREKGGSLFDDNLRKEMLCDLTCELLR